MEAVRVSRLSDSPSPRRVPHATIAAVYNMSENAQPDLEESRRDVVRAELNRLLNSPAFRQSKRCRDFIEYIVEHTMTGPSGALKERSIGVELFQLPPDFDTGQHTIVRVTANEVRKKLARHYLAENGSPHEVRISLPTGSYGVDLAWGTPAVETQPLEEIAPPAEPQTSAAEDDGVAKIEAPPDAGSFPIPNSPGRTVSGLVAATVLVVAAAVGWWLWNTHNAADPKAGSVSAVLGPNAASLAGTRLMLVGSDARYTDRSGRTWDADRFFTGGATFVRPAERIFRTLDPDIYRHARQGEFRYDIPLDPGSYELHLHFAETGLADSISAESSGEGQRLFSVSANGKLLLELFDVVADANGSNTSDERVFRNVSPAEDGVLHLSFVPQRGTATLSGIELVAVNPGKVRPLRIRAGWTAGWQDSTGEQWRADSYFLGGNALVRPTNPARASDTVPDMALYTSERWGHFSYAIPVAEGRYRLTLRFCEGHYGRGNSGVGGMGSRVFDVYCNGVALMRNFDIYKQAGGEGRPVDRTFAGLRPNAQGKILLSFVPVIGMACLNGIEVVEDFK
jgi:hypothetical protein